MEDFFSFLDFLDEDGCRSLSVLLSEKKISAGDVLFDYGDPAESIFFLNHGCLSVHKFTGFQEKMQVIALLDPGAIIGEAAILQNHVHQTRVSAIEDCQLYCLNRKDFSGLKDQSSELTSRFLEHILSIVTLRLEKTSDRLARVL